MANRIKQLREEFHMTQVRLSIELGVSQETISAYENQKHYPSFIQLQKLSELFCASIDYIMGLSEIRAPVMLAEDETISRLISMGKSLTKEQLELVLVYMQGVKDASKLLENSPS